MSVTGAVFLTDNPVVALSLIWVIGGAPLILVIIASAAAGANGCGLDEAGAYLLADYDDLARRLILAHHTAMIDRRTLERWLNDGAHALRSLFSLAQQYRYSGTQRDDFAANNAAARAAREKFGELPQDVLEGTRRSRFAPPIVRRSGLAQRATPPTTTTTAVPQDAAAADNAPTDWTTANDGTEAA